jgi:Sulfotransferase family
MLRDLLRSHPNLSIPPESYFIPRFYWAWGDPTSGREARALARRILALRSVRRWELEVEPSACTPCRSFAEVLDVIYGEFARREGGRRWGDKTPDQVRDIPTLARIFPRAKIIHVFRDGRDVALSWARHPFGPRNLFAAATKWKRHVSAGRRDGPALRDSYIEVRYEDLLRDPMNAMRKVCEFLDEPFTEDVLRPAPRYRMYAWRTMRQGTFRERTEIERHNHGNWKTLMPLADRMLFESIAGDLLVELDYEVEGLAQAIPRRRRAWWALDNEIRSSLSRTRVRQLAVRDTVTMLHADLRGRFRPAGAARSA